MACLSTIHLHLERRVTDVNYFGKTIKDKKIILRDEREEQMYGVTMSVVDRRNYNKGD